jgi:hypothetical protein
MKEGVQPKFFASHLSFESGLKKLDNECKTRSYKNKQAAKTDCSKRSRKTILSLRFISLLRLYIHCN